MEVTEEVIETRSQAASPLSEVLPGALITALVTLLFFSLYWNRFAGLRSGNGSFQGGMALLKGILPYRDYFTAGPPLNQVISAAVLGVFGQKLIVIRAWGVFERIALAVLLYLWLAKLFQARHAAFAAIVAVILSAGDSANQLSSYGSEAIFFFLLSGWATTKAVEKAQSIGLFSAWAIAAGLSAAISLGTKQTLGAGATVGIPILAAIFISRASGVRRAVFFVVAFAAGWCLGIGAIFIWLTDIGVVHAFLDDAFKKGPSAKASHPTDFIVRAARAAWGIKKGVFFACLGLLFSWPALRRTGRLHRPVDKSTQVVSIAVLASVAIAVGAAISYAGYWPLQDFATFTIYLGFFGCVLLLIFAGLKFLRGSLSQRELQIGFLAGISFGIALMVSLSWPALYDMVFPSFGLIVAAVLHGSGKNLRYATYGVCTLVLVAITCEKLNRPHGFHEWFDEPVRLANTRSSIPALEGIILPKRTVDFIDGTYRIVQDHSTTSDTIFIYPEFGIFYTLTNRRYPTVTDSHNIDVVNDEFARSEAQRVLQNKPAVVVYYPVPAWSLRADERAWRGGHPSGQRDLIAAVEQLTSKYHLAATFKVPPNDPVKVYVRQ